MAIIATVGASNANSYATLAEADLFFDTEIGSSEWFESVNQEAALIKACRKLDRFGYIGDKATTTQALEWPRIINDLYELNHDEFPFLSTVIPPNLKNAQCVIALQVIQVGGTTSEGSVSELQIGNSVKAKFTTGGATVRATVDYSGIPLAAAEYLAGLRLISVLA